MINARNFVKYYDWQHLDINWATGTNDVRKELGTKFSLLGVIFTLNFFLNSFSVILTINFCYTYRLLRMHYATCFDCYVDHFNSPDSTLLLQLLLGVSSLIYVGHLNTTVLSFFKVSGKELFFQLIRR